MYKLVFLLIFSAAYVTGANHIMLDIDIKTETETRCEVSPVGTQTLTEGENIEFHIQTPTKLVDFWCNNARGILLYHPELTIPIQNNPKMVYALPATSIGSKSYTDGTWNCSFQILRKASILNKHESTCMFQVKVTDEPGVSLRIAQLSQWTWINKLKGIKRYNYSFTEGNNAFDCILANPTNNEEIYTVSFKLDNLQQKRLPNVIIKAYSKTNFRDNFKLKNDSKLITCSAVNVKGNGANLQNEIHLQYTPPPLVHLVSQSNPQKLIHGELFKENNTQIYDYDFTDGEEVTINCALNKAGGYEEDYSLQLCKKRNCTEWKGLETFISHTFTLEKGDEYIQCTAVNKKTATDPSLPRHLYNIVHLHYTPPREDTQETDVPLLSFTGPEKLQQWNNRYNYNFTDGENVTLYCLLDSRAGYDKDYTIEMYLKSANSDFETFVTSNKELKTSTSVGHTFTLQNNNQAIICVAHDTPRVPKYSIRVHLHYTQQPAQELKFYVDGSSDLKEEIFYRDNLTQIYSYDFTDDANITVTGTLAVNEGNKDSYEIEFYLDGIKQNGREPKVLIHGTLSKEVTLTLNENNKNITFVVQDKKTKKPVRTHKVKLNKHKKRKSASGTELKMEGLPENSCNSTDEYGLNKICNYTLNDSARIGTTELLKCVLTSTGNDEFDMKFGSHNKRVTFKKGKTSSKIVSYAIPLKEGINTETCTATKIGVLFKLTVTVNVYNPPPTTTSTTTTEQPTTQTIESTTTTQVSSAVQQPQPTDPGSPAGGGEDSSTGWLKWALGGGAALITICVVVGCIVIHRQKKSPPADSTYANLTKDQNKSTPVPAPRTIQKPNIAQKPNGAGKPNVALDNNYSEPKDSQDMSEALYADPNRFVGDSSNYAEPYVAKPSPQSDMYAEPYKSNYAEPYPSSSEGNYAELNLPDSSGKELYAKPIPKAQRKLKVKDDCNYSNVFGTQYGNTTK